jgi:uncharacterized protein YggT (Ycf19 family)
MLPGRRIPEIMPLIDFILNIACLLLWLNWLAINFDPMARATAATLIGTLKKADSARPRRWKFLIGLAALLYFRALIYWQVGSSVSWTPSLQMGPIVLSFRSDILPRMLLFSLLSFLLTLAFFYLWLLLFSIANHHVPDSDPTQKLVRLHLRWLEPLPWVIRVFLPLVIIGILWLFIYPLLTRLAIIPHVKSGIHLAEEAVVIGLGSYLAWKYLIAGILLLHLFSSYIYVGKHPFWDFVNATAGNLLRPLRWIPLHIGKLDLSPLLGVVLVLLIAEFCTKGLVIPHLFGVPGLTQLYQWLPW